jgi:hypothetical protein
VGLVVVADLCAATHQDPPWLDATFGLPLVLFLPGYAVVRAFRPQRLDAAQRLIASIAVSLALAILVGLTLNWLPGGIDATSERASLSAVAILAATVAWTRHCVLWRDGRHRATVGRGLRPIGSLRPLMAGAAAVALTGVGLGIAQQAAANQQHDEAPTALWLSPDSGRHGRLRLGVTNGDQGAARYRLVLVDGAAVVGRWSILVPRGGTWSTDAALPEASARRRIQAMLYRAGGHRPIRRVAEAETR